MAGTLASELDTSVPIITPADVVLNGLIRFSAAFSPVSGRLVWCNVLQNVCLAGGTTSG